MNINYTDLYNIFKIIFIKYFSTIKYNMENLKIEVKKYENKIYS